MFRTYFFPKRACPKKNARSITFTFASQLGANFEIKFLIVDRNCWLTLIFQKKSVSLKIRYSDNPPFLCQQVTQYLS